MNWASFQRNLGDALCPMHELFTDSILYSGGYVCVRLLSKNMQMLQR